MNCLLFFIHTGSQKSTQTTVSHPAPDPWSSGPWSRKGRAKGRPDPLWRPISDDIPQDNEPPSSSTPKTIICSEEKTSDGAPPSPRTLQAIQAAMMDSSSDEDELASKKSTQDGNGTATSQEGNGGVSPRTLHAIQKALMEDNNESEDLCEEVQAKQKKCVIISSSDDDNDDDDPVGNTVNDRSIQGEAREGGGVSPQTLLAIQRALGEKKLFTGRQMKHVDLVSSSDGEEMEEVVGVRSKEFKTAAHAEEEEHNQGAVQAAFSTSDLQSDEDSVSQDHKPSGESEHNFLQKGSLSINLITKERDEQIVIKSDEEDSSSEGIYATVRSSSNSAQLCFSYILLIKRRNNDTKLELVFNMCFAGVIPS